MAYMDIELVLGEVVHTNPILRYCVVAFVGRGGSVTASYSGLSAQSIREAQVDPGITIGDRVVVLVPSGDGTDDQSELTGGVVLCKVTANMLSFPELLNNEGDAKKTLKDLNELLKNSSLHKLYDTLRHYVTGKDLEVFFPPNTRPDELIEGDCSISQGDCRLLVSDGVITLGSKYAKMALTDNGTILTDCLFNNTRDAAGWRKTSVLGGCRQTEEFRRIVDADKMDGVLHQCGLLSNGETNTLIREGLPVSQWGVDASGSFFQTSARGFRSVMGGSMSFRTVGSCDSLCSIDKKTEDELAYGTEKDVTELIDSDKYLKDKISGADVLLSPTELDPIKDPTTASSADEVISSIVHQTPDGGIVLRDSWGSEIRMFGGDIFITPARNIVTTVPGDAVTGVGGVVSCSATLGVNIGSGDGPVELVGRTSAMLVSDNKAGIIGKNGAVEAGESGIEVASSDKLSAQVTKGVELVSGDSIFAAGETVVSLGRESNSVVTSSTALKQSRGQIELGGSCVNVLSDIIISSKKSSELSIGTYKSRPQSGNGSIWCDGYITADKGISTNKWIKADGLVSCEAVTASSVNKEAIGVFMGKKPGATEIRKPTDVKLKSPKVGTVDPKKISIKDRLANIFKLVSSGVYAILPKRRNKSAITPTTIDRTGDKGYIYPGEAFWNKAGKYTVNGEKLTNISYTVTYEKTGMSN